MICVTGLEKTPQALLARLGQCKSYPMQEIRLDALEGALPTGDALPVPPGELVVTCRRPAEGGRFAGNETERLKRLEKALEWHPGWIDLEEDLPESSAAPVLEKARRLEVRILRSLHLMDDLEPGSITRALARLSSAYGHGIKLAARVEDAIRLEEFLVAPRTRPAVLVGMGPAGLLSRALSRRFHCEWTYFAAHGDPRLPEGMPDLELARAWNLPVDGDRDLLVLLGGPSIVRSPGPAVYNHLFRERGFRGVYLPAVTEHAEQTFGLLCRLGLKGASVTIPHKVKALELASEASYGAVASGSANTLYLTDQGCWRGESTDIPAVQALVSALAETPPRKGAVLGTGGFARACAFALAEKGIEPFLMGRTILLGNGPWKASWPLAALTEMDFDVLINATPVGSDPGDAPLVPEGVSLRGKIVLDAVMAGKPTRLLERARAEGARMAGGAELWAEQGARQMACFGGPAVAPGELLALAVEHAGLSQAGGTGGGGS